MVIIGRPLTITIVPSGLHLFWHSAKTYVRNIILSHQLGWVELGNHKSASPYFVQEGFVHPITIS